ncbi:MAG: MFS transporter [Planctomycetales bacterium]|nr:MFS transporter [Planctomycetales bacterium]MCA9167651.1 MFS transporter [Planctomycetales bacterium]
MSPLSLTVSIRWSRLALHMDVHDPYAALRLPDYRRYFIGNFASNFGLQMQTVAVGWDIFERTHESLALGLTGLAQFLPVVLLFLLAGHVADRFPRRWIIICSQVLVGSASIGLAIIYLTQADYRLIYVCLTAVGIARSFQQPAKAAILPLLVPTEKFSNAVTWSSSGFHLASVLGPAAGGLLIHWTGGPVAAYALDACCAVIFAICLWFTRPRPMEGAQRGLKLDELVAGFRFLKGHQVVLGALLLDLFAVLLGGAVALLPVFAAPEMLNVGASGLGWLRMSPALGALAVAILLAHRPPMSQAGVALLLSVAGFGLATVGFGLSRNFALSMLMLALTGAFDNVSVVIRHTLVQTNTPDQLRGRVSAVNSLFIGASNELGAFESGFVAHYFSPVVSVVSGGLGTLLVVIITAIKLPRLRRYGRLGDVPHDE